MPANEFEKQVQDQMGQFQLDPSATVWEKVETEIRKKKRRRAILFLILPVLIGLIVFIGYNYKNNGQPSVAGSDRQPVLPQENNAHDAKTIKSSSVNLPPTNELTASSTEKPGAANSLTAGKATVDSKKPIPGTPIRMQNENAELEINTRLAKKKKKAKQSNEEETILIATTTAGIYSTTAGKKKEDANSSTSGNKTNPADDPNETRVAVNHDEERKPVVAAPVPDTTKATEEISITKKEKKKSGGLPVRWGIVFSAGRSANSGGLLSFDFSNRSADYAYANTPSTGSGSPVTGNSSGARSPSAIRAGLSFRVGVEAELQLTKKSRVSTGLQYQYISTHISPGVKKDTSVMLANSYAFLQLNQVYSNRSSAQQSDPKSNYTNSYHFIQVPVWYHWQINKGKKLPVDWNLGLSVAWLAATNALVYDTTSGGIYYRNKNAFTKTHFNLATGFSFRMNMKNGMEWVIGPELSIDLTKPVSNPYDRKQYLWYGGISARLLFPQKKK